MKDLSEKFEEWFNDYVKGWRIFEYDKVMPERPERVKGAMWSAYIAGGNNKAYLDKRAIKELAEEIVEANRNTPYGGYMCHGEYHRYKKLLTVEEVVEIINKKFGVRPG